MNTTTIRIVPKRDNPQAIVPGLLAHLSDIDHDYMIADPCPDFRGWKVTLPDGRKVGKVEGVIIDTTTITGRYIEVKVDEEALLDDEGRFVLVPVESVRVDRDETRVMIDHLPVGGLEGAPQHTGELPNAEEQRAILAYFEITSVGAPHG